MAPVFIAALSALAVAVTLGLYRVIGRFLSKALRDTLHEAITETVQPQLTGAEARLTAALNNLREQGTAEHAVVAMRLSALEDRVAAVEARLPSDP